MGSIHLTYEKNWYLLSWKGNIFFINWDFYISLCNAIKYSIVMYNIKVTFISKQKYAFHRHSKLTTIIDCIAFRKSAYPKHIINWWKFGFSIFFNFFFKWGGGVKDVPKMSNSPNLCLSILYYRNNLCRYNFLDLQMYTSMLVKWN